MDFHEWRARLLQWRRRRERAALVIQRAWRVRQQQRRDEQYRRERAVLVIQRAWSTYQLGQIDRREAVVREQQRIIDLALGAIAERRAARLAVAREVVPETARVEFAAITIQRGWTAHKLHQATRTADAARLASRQAYLAEVDTQAELAGWVERANEANLALQRAAEQQTRRENRHAELLRGEQFDLRLAALADEAFPNPEWDQQLLAEDRSERASFNRAYYRRTGRIRIRWAPRDENSLI